MEALSGSLGGGVERERYERVCMSDDMYEGGEWRCKIEE